MCGIAGLITRKGEANESVVDAMCKAIIHRGPDDQGIHSDGPCSIGMRRLSIIDLSTGHQPISNEDDSLWIVFNGEIYQYRELRENLVKQGHKFRTASDTEVILHLIEQEGAAGISKLRGMFTFAIWNSKTRKLLLARDRFGKKPLYYSITSDGLFFGSELKCLRVAGVPLEIDNAALRQYFQFSYIPDPLSPYSGIKKLPPGSWLTYDSETGHVEQGQYWKLPYPAEVAEPGVSDADYRRLLREKFDESVRIRMVADVPLGAFLSGGIDSTSVVASMAQFTKEPVKTFSIGFEESAFNELPWAKQVAQQYNTEHHEILVRPDSISLVNKLVDSFDEPFADASAIPTYLVSEFAARRVKVALTGDGGDELFGGYESFFWLQKMRKYNRIPLMVRRAISALTDRLSYSAYGKNYMRIMTRPNLMELYFELNYMPFYLRQQLLTPEWMEPGDAGYIMRTFGDYLAPNGADILTHAMYFEATAKLTGNMLPKVDRMSMAASLEVRCPMLDHELAELAARIPHQAKMRNGKGKAILIEAIGDRLPPNLLTRPKSGFNVPLSIWFRGSLREFLWDHLTSATFVRRGMASGAFVRQLLEEHDSGRRDNNHWLWTLLMLELWMKKFDSRS